MGPRDTLGLPAWMNPCTLSGFRVWSLRIANVAPDPGCILLHQSCRVDCYPGRPLLDSGLRAWMTATASTLS